LYGIPAETDLSFLRDKTLTQVGFGPWDLQLHFHEEITHITVTSTIGYALADGAYAERSISPQEGVVPVHEDPCPLLRLLMKKVTDVSWTREGTLTLEFEGAARVQIYDNLGPYECYTITHNDDFFVM
jgi:hypothetical protein